jgi:hypothetical protein
LWPSHNISHDFSPPCVFTGLERLPMVPPTWPEEGHRVPGKGPGKRSTRGRGKHQTKVLPPGGSKPEDPEIENLCARFVTRR